MAASQFRVSDTSQTHPGLPGDFCDRVPQGLARGRAPCRTWSTAHELETHDRFIVLAPDSTVPALTDERRTLSIAGVAGPVGVPRRRHDRRRQVRCPCVHSPRMSYTLTGRIQSRLVATLPPLLLALGIHRWWAVELVALMLAVRRRARHLRLRPRARLPARLARATARARSSWADRRSPCACP